jgi:23S rRNA maturation-related 3'-5' exoribonuclease YhaM
MTPEEKIKIFESELNTIVYEDIRNYAIELLQNAPDYFYEVEAASNPNHHPSYAHGIGGLIRHEKGLFRFLNHLLELEQYNIFTDREKDLLRVAALAHDIKKHGENGSPFMVHDHPMLAANFVLKFCNQDTISQEEKNFVADCIRSHMGQWNTSKRNKIVLPKPETEAQKFLHMCDYLASRTDIEIKFDSTEVTAPTITPEDYVFPFGKHMGKKLIDVAKSDRGYILWAKENIDREPLKSLLSQI